MANIDYEARIVVTCKGKTVDRVVIDDEDYGFLMRRISTWANQSEAYKDL